MIKNRIGLFYLIITLLVLSGCAGAADYDIDLSGNYSLLKGSAHDVKIQPKISADVWDANDSKIVPAEVIEIGWNDDYIIAKQLTNQKEHNFWIIDVEKEQVIGPLNELDFIGKKKEYGINNDIVLKEVKYLNKE